MSLSGGTDVRVRVVNALTTRPIYNTRAMAKGSAAFISEFRRMTNKVIKPTASRKITKCRTPPHRECFYTMVAFTSPKELLSSATLSVLPVMEALAFTESFIRVRPSVGVLPALLFAIVIIVFPRRNSRIRCRPLAGCVCDTTPKLTIWLNVLLLANLVNVVFATWPPLALLGPYRLTRCVTLAVAFGALFAITPILTFVDRYPVMVVGILGWTGLSTVIILRNDKLPLVINDI